MIYGVGTDICAVARMTHLLARYGDRPAGRILTATERADFGHAHGPDRFLAKRFAAKEAFSKAIGTGFRHPVSLRAVGVGHDAHGKPILEYGPTLAALMADRKLWAHLSISDEQDFALAFVVVEQER